jgi:hypothetical protein
MIKNRANKNVLSFLFVKYLKSKKLNMLIMIVNTIPIRILSILLGLKFNPKILCIKLVNM